MEGQCRSSYGRAQDHLIHSETYAENERALSSSKYFVATAGEFLADGDALEVLIREPLRNSSLPDEAKLLFKAELLNVLDATTVASRSGTQSEIKTPSLEVFDASEEIPMAA